MKALLVIGSIVAALAAAGTAGAAGEDGAYVYASSSCSPTPFGLICLDQKTVTNVTQTPSGSLSYVTNGTLELSYTQPFTGCSVSSSQSFHLHWAEQGGDARSHGERRSYTTQVGCDGSVETCVTTVAFQYGNGDVQFDRSEVVCTNE
jgi:hypothetical protein